MIAREALLTALLLLGLIAAGMCAAGVIGWMPPAALGAAALAAVVERRFYQRRTGGRPGPEWQPTGEQRIDPESGALIRTWRDGETGERREVRSEAPLH